MLKFWVSNQPMTLCYPTQVPLRSRVLLPPWLLRIPGLGCRLALGLELQQGLMGPTGTEVAVRHPGGCILPVRRGSDCRTGTRTAGGGGLYLENNLITGILRRHGSN